MLSFVKLCIKREASSLSIIIILILHSCKVITSSWNSLLRDLFGGIRDRGRVSMVESC